ncbi:MAG: hypothetical protein PHN88_02835 [Ignavibacteria bacterium]|nr:hypothetical protein [Ignavibacteria bacterium]
MINISINSESTFQNIDKSIDDTAKNIDKKLREAKNKVAEMIKESIEQNLYSGLDYFGNAVAPKKKGGRIFFESGELFKSVFNQDVSAFLSTVYIGTARDVIAGYLTNGTENMVARPFWGLNKNIDDKVEKIVEEIFNKK